MNLSVLLAGMGALALLSQDKKRLEKKPFDCPVCIDLDPYRDEPACAQCEKHHDWMQAACSRKKHLAEAVVDMRLSQEESLVKVSDQAMEIARLKSQQNLTRVVYAGWGALAATVICALTFM